MTKIIKVIIQKNRFNIEKEIKALTKRRLAVGSVTAFVGMVRDISDKKDLKYLELEHYPGMTEKALRGICNEAAERWSVEGIIVSTELVDYFLGKISLWFSYRPSIERKLTWPMNLLWIFLNHRHQSGKKLQRQAIG